jgi:hypothetical protein
VNIETSPLRFDQALPALVSESVKIVGRSAFESAGLIVLRDIAGLLTLIVRDKEILAHRARLLDRLVVLRPYVDDNPIATPDELFDEYLSAPKAGFREAVFLPDGSSLDVHLVDRRLVGADWQRGPLEPVTETPIAVFWSLKGGVGRSTALCVAAATLARQGYDILAIDLDLEAPGIGDMLLNAGDQPEFGAMDFFVENGFGTVDDAFLRNMIGASRLTDGRGLVSVVPAIGRATERSPQNMLAKLARAYIDKPVLGGSASFLDQTRDLVARLTHANHYDAVLIDARAGLNESTAASLLGLGGTALLFGVDTPQTFHGYRTAFAHLNRFVIEGDENTWRERLQMVHAKAESIAVKQRNFRDRSFDLFSEWLYEESDFNRQDVFNFDLDDDNAPHFPWTILHDSNFLEFDPVAHPEQLTSELSVRTFGNFVERLAIRLDLAIEFDTGLRL